MPAEIEAYAERTLFVKNSSTYMLGYLLTTLSIPGVDRSEVKI